MKKIEQQVAIFPETEFPMIRDLHRLIDKQVPRVGPMPVRCAQKARMGDEQQIATLVAVVQVPA